MLKATATIEPGEQAWELLNRLAKVYVAPGAEFPAPKGSGWLLRYSVDLLLISLLISGISAALGYLALHYMFVRPMRRVTANMMAFRADPERHKLHTPSGRIASNSIASAAMTAKCISHHLSPARCRSLRSASGDLEDCARRA